MDNNKKNVIWRLQQWYLYANLNKPVIGKE